MKLSEWNECLAAAHELATQNGIKCEPYSMFDGRNGIRFYVLDADNKPYGKQMYTGVCKDRSELMDAINRCIHGMAVI